MEENNLNIGMKGHKDKTQTWHKQKNTKPNKYKNLLVAHTESKIIFFFLNKTNMKTKTETVYEVRPRFLTRGRE